MNCKAGDSVVVDKWLIGWMYARTTIWIALQIVSMSMKAMACNLPWQANISSWSEVARRKVGNNLESSLTRCDGGVQLLVVVVVVVVVAHIEERIRESERSASLPTKLMLVK
jgi:hypothetical protein